jgi:hypothetical protein
MAMMAPSAGRPDIRDNVRDILERRTSAAPPKVKERVHSYVHRLVHAQSLDHKEGMMGKPGCKAEGVKDEIFGECRKDPAFRKEWEDASRHMLEIDREFRNPENLQKPDGEPEKKDLFSEKKAGQFEALIRDMGSVNIRLQERDKPSA